VRVTKGGWKIPASFFLVHSDLVVHRINPDSAVERERVSKEQTFRSEDMPFGIANGKSWQISNSKIWNLQFAI
jgi:hypothetical protein